MHATALDSIKSSVFLLATCFSRLIGSCCLLSDLADSFESVDRSRDLQLTLITLLPVLCLFFYCHQH